MCVHSVRPAGGTDCFGFDECFNKYTYLSKNTFLSENPPFVHLPDKEGKNTISVLTWNVGKNKSIKLKDVVSWKLVYLLIQYNFTPTNSSCWVSVQQHNYKSSWAYRCTAVQRRRRCVTASRGPRSRLSPLWNISRKPTRINNCPNDSSHSVTATCKKQIGPFLMGRLISLDSNSCHAQRLPLSTPSGSTCELEQHSQVTVAPHTGQSCHCGINVNIGFFFFASRIKKVLSFIYF